MRSLSKLGCLVVVVREARVGEQVSGARVQEELRVLGLLDQRLGGGPILLRPRVGIHHVDLHGHALGPRPAELGRGDAAE